MVHLLRLQRRKRVVKVCLFYSAMNFIGILLFSNLLSFRIQFLDFSCTFILQASTACELPPIFVPEIDDNYGPAEQSDWGLSAWEWQELWKS
jgi:hypothetical protein